MDDLLCLLSFLGYRPIWYLEWYDPRRPRKEPADRPRIVPRAG